MQFYLKWMGVVDVNFFFYFYLLRSFTVQPCGTHQLPAAPPHEELQRQLQQLKQVISQLEDRLRLQGVCLCAHFDDSKHLPVVITCLFYKLFADGIAAAATVGIGVVSDGDSNLPCSSSYIQKQVVYSHITFQ